MTGHLRIVALLAVFTVIAPLCGSLMATGCDGRCCGKMTTCPCQDALCMTSQPATPATAVDSAPAQQTASVVESLPGASTAFVREGPEIAWSVRLSPEHSPPDVYLLHCLLLI